MTAPLKKIKHYEILSILGKGGMGEVYLALDTNLNRKVAIKFLPEVMHQDQKARERFIREAKSAAALDHPFICKIYEAGEFEGHSYIVMEYVEGTTIREKIAEKPFSLQEALRVILGVAEALEIAHDKGIVHRDLKPANLMCTLQGHVKVMDFGLAKQVLPDGDAGQDTHTLMKTLTQASLTGQGMIVGTLAYMSPEQAKGDPVDARSDIFSLGVILNELATGIHPFDRGTPVETLTAVLRDDPPSVNIKPRTYIPALSRILHSALAKDPAKRYQKISEFVADIRKLQEDVAGGTGVRHKRNPLAIGSFIAAIAIAFAVFQINRRPQIVTPESGPSPIAVIIVDTVNTTGEVLFDGVLEKVLGVGLGATSYISVYDSKLARQQAIELEPGSEGRLDLDLAQLISRRAGINAVVCSSIEPDNQGYLIGVSAWDPTKSEMIAEAERSIQSKTDIFKVADILSAKLRSELVVIPDDSTETLIKETFTTHSLEAMHAYAKGQELDDLGQPDEAINWLLKALDFDPNFGRAYTTLGVIYYNRGQYEDAKNYFQEGIKRIDQMTDREKYRARGPYYLMVRNFKKAIEEYSTLLEQFPGDYSAHANLALAYFFARNMPKAVEEGLLDIQLNPQSINGRYNLSWYALGAGDFAMAEEESRNVLTTRPEFAEAYVTLALSQLAQDKLDGAAELYERLGEIDTFGASVAATGLADIAIYEGRLNDAVSLLRSGIAFDLENEWVYNAADKSVMLADALFLQSKHKEALQAINRALEIDRNDNVLFSAARMYIKTGQTAQAREFAAELDKKLEPEPMVYAKLIEGDMSLARGDARNAIKLCLEAQEILDTWLGRLLLGRAYLEAKAYTEAYSEFDLCLRRKGEAASIFLNDLPSYRFYPQVIYYLGRAQGGLGSDAAADSFREFLNIMENADEGISVIEDAKRRLSGFE